MLSAVAAGPLAAQPVAPAAPTASNADMIKRGEYLVRAGDCASCHTGAGGAGLSGGQMIDTPYGGIASPNITPDKATGIGDWSDDEFYRIMHEGLGRHGEYIYPVMPFTNYTKITRDDDMAIKAYLFSQPAVHAPRKNNTLSFPYSVRESVLAWRTLFFKPDTFQADPAKSVQINRGGYLVEGLGHCGACHTARNFLSATKEGEAYGGGEIKGQGWFAPNITSDVKQGIGGWAEQDVVDYLQKGVATNKAIVAGPMYEVVHTSMQYMTNDDVHAIAAFLKQVPAKQLYGEQKHVDDPQGRVAYLENCGFCHQENGQGIANAIPPLAGNGVVLAEGAHDVLRTIIGGMPANGQYAPMPGLVKAIDPGEIALIANYIRSSFGNAAPSNATPELVADLSRTTATMLSGTSQCAKIEDPTVAQAIQSSGVEATLHEVDAGNGLEKLRIILPKLKAAKPDMTQADAINGLTSAYCPIVSEDNSIPLEQRTQQLQRFSMLVFTGITNYEMPTRKSLAAPPAKN